MFLVGCRPERGFIFILLTYMPLPVRLWNLELNTCVVMVGVGRREEISEQME